MIRVVVFDFDGTLADTNAIKEECLCRAVASIKDGASALGAALKAGGDRYKVFAEVARRVTPNCDPRIVKMQARVLVESYSRCCTKGIVAAAERRQAANGDAAYSNLVIRSNIQISEMKDINP